VVMSGGGLFNHLDYSFAAGYEGGTFAYPPTQPGGGNAAFRRQMRVLRDFIHALDFIHMRPDDVIVTEATAGVTARALVLPSKAIAIFLKGDAPSATISVRIPAGTWTVEWVNTRTGAVARGANVSGGKVQALAAPAFDSDVALRLRRQ
jgi:hypothetical protein